MPKTNATTGEWTMEALIAKQNERYEHFKKLRAAVNYANDNGLRAKAAMSKAHAVGLHLSITWNMVHNVLSGRSKRATGQRMPWDILTESETKNLVDWIKACAINKDPAMDQHVSAKIVEMLKARKAHNKLKRDSVKAGAMPLTRLEKRLVETRGATVSHVFLQHLAARYPEIQHKCENNIDATRAKKMNEHVVEKHFNGDTGLVKSMQHHGIMDENEHIPDPRRVWALDELGQFFEHGGVGPRPKAWGIRRECPRGPSCKEAEAHSREGGLRASI
jgi:hypothetical protein